MSGRKRFFALTVCAVLALALLASSVYLVGASGHCCESPHCEICQTALRASALPRMLAYAVTLLAAPLLLPRARTVERVGRAVSFREEATLVTWKIRLND